MGRWRETAGDHLPHAWNVLATPMATAATGQNKGANTSVQVTPQGQTRVYTSYHRTKHECAGQITGPNTSVQVTPQDQIRVEYRSDHRTKHECAGRTTGPNTSVQVTPQDQIRVCRSDDRTKHESAGQLICCQRGDGDEVMLNVLRCQLTY